MTLKQLLLSIKIQNLSNTPEKDFRYLSVQVSNLRKIIKSTSEETLLKVYTGNRQAFTNISKVENNWIFTPKVDWTNEYVAVLRSFVYYSERI